MRAFQVYKWKGTSLLERLLIWALTRKVINVQGIEAVHEPVQSSPYLSDSPTDSELIQSARSTFRGLLKQEMEARSLRKVPRRTFLNIK